MSQICLGMVLISILVLDGVPPTCRENGTALTESIECVGKPSLRACSRAQVRSSRRRPISKRRRYWVNRHMSASRATDPTDQLAIPRVDINGSGVAF